MTTYLNSPSFNISWLLNTVVVQGRLFLTEFSPFRGSCRNCGPFPFLFRFSLSLVLCRAFHAEKRDRRKEIETG